eukprot:54884_1
MSQTIGFEHKQINDNDNNNEDNEQKKQPLHDNNNKNVQFETNWNKIVDSFECMNLKEEILRGIFGYGWETPSAIQQRAILPVLTGKDTIAQAQSGTGKTGSFSIAALQRIDCRNNECQVIILSPTRELARQSHGVITKLGQYLNITSRVCVGGTSVRNDISALQNGVQIVVGTPGRVCDMIERGILKTESLSLFVLDEADIMLSKGFKEKMYTIFQYIPQSAQVTLFSATMPREILLITQRFMRDPVRILVKKEMVTLDGIKQFYIAVEKEDFKLATLIDLYESLNITQAIIFVNRKQKAMWLTDKMKQNDFIISVMHGGLEQHERELVMKEFRSGTTRVLIATDLLARGIDVNTISLVINYDLPTDKSTYIHRIGRSGRYGKKGCAINFVRDEDETDLRELEQFYNTKIDELPE